MKNRSGRGLRQKVLVLGFWSGREPRRSKELGWRCDINCEMMEVWARTRKTSQV